MLIAILMSLNIVSVGYATWAITGPSTDRTDDGGFVSYPVIKSDDYYTLTTAMDFQGYFNNGSQGYFVLVDAVSGDLRPATEDEAREATITLTYKAATDKKLDNPTITTTILFGDTATTKLFFGTTQAPNITIEGGTLKGANQTTILTDGAFTFTFTPNANETKSTVTIKLKTATGKTFPTGLQSGMYAFTFNTTVQGTPAN